MEVLVCCSAVSIVVELTHLHLFINFSFMQETSHNVEAAVDRGINDPSTDKCKVIFIFILFIFIFELSCAPMCLTCSFFYRMPLVWFNSLCLLLLIIALFFASLL